MSLADLNTLDLVGMVLGLGLTLMVFSYLLGDNPLFRLAIHIFIGVAAGYAAVVAWYSVLWPQLVRPLLQGSTAERIFLLVPLVLGALLLLKASPRLSHWGNLPVAFLVGVGAATAIGGSVLGTLFPQSLATINLFDEQGLFVEGMSTTLRAVEAVMILVGVLCTLVYFQFRASPQANQSPRRSSMVESMAWIGQFFIAAALGALFAGVYAAALVALIERLQFAVSLILALVIPQ